MAPRKKAPAPGLFGPDEPNDPAEIPEPAKAPRKRTARSAPAAAADDKVQMALSRLPDLVERLEALIADVPKAEQFEPLAEHIYSFAQSGPRLMESLESVKDAVPQIESATQALGETATTLQDTNQRLAESLMRMPAAEDYEPFSAPLVEFTKISPALTATLREAMLSFSAVSEVTRRLEAFSKSLKHLEGGEPAPPPSKSKGKAAAAGAERHGKVAESLDTLANEIDGALEKLPKDPEYARVADQLRELATVSPSLMDWMKEVKPLSPPLAASVLTLRRVANQLRDNAAVLRGDKNQ
jgi:DNA repair ATPase RecN